MKTVLLTLKVDTSLTNISPAIFHKLLINEADDSSYATLSKGQIVEYELNCLLKGEAVVENIEIDTKHSDKQKWVNWPDVKVDLRATNVLQIDS